MSESFESQSWYRAAHLCPKLAARAEISRQIFRGVPWIVMRNPISGKFHRISESANFVVAIMDGVRSLGEIWNIACQELGDDAPSQDELLGVVAQLNLIDLMHTDGLPNASEIARRSAKLQRRSGLVRFLNPLALRFPLFDPNNLLDEAWPLIRPLFSIFGALAYMALIVAGIVTASIHWGPLTGNIVDRVLATENVLILILVYPFVKALHELGHGFAVKKWGGEVHEIGLMFLVFIPVPYVDASAASSFIRKGPRMLVGAAGILVELGLAAIAVLVWTGIEEGFFRALAFNVILIGGVSTLLFNGNPLLKFDGYYVLSDWLEIPNLGKRSNSYLGYLIQRYLFGLERARNPVRAKGEAIWLFGYSISAFTYRLFISFVIVTFVATKFFFIGVLLAFWSVSLMFLLPLLRHLKFLFFGDSLRGLRARAVLASTALVTVGLMFLLVIPVPYRTVAQGVVHVPSDAIVYAEETGLVSEVVGFPNQLMELGSAIAVLDDPFVTAELKVAEAEAAKLKLRYHQAFEESAFDVVFWRAQAARATQEAKHLHDRITGLTLVSPGQGNLVLPRSSDLLGRFLKKGEVVGYVVSPSEYVVRVAVPQSSADLIRRRTKSVEIVPAENLKLWQKAKIVREVPTVGDVLPSLALSSVGGGPFALDPTYGDRPHSLIPLMQFDVAVEDVLVTTVIGTRYYVRFDHGSEPLGARIWRSIRQLFLKRFNV
jgi:putative peptide zinc metalloprotease protein